MHQRHGTVWWSELMTRDGEAAQAFYHTICDWEFSSMETGSGPYCLCMRDKRPVAGIFDMRGAPGTEHTPIQWMTYLAVDDVDRAASLVQSEGGAVLRPPFDVPDIGRILMARDSSGAVVGLITPVEFRPQD